MKRLLIAALLVLSPVAVFTQQDLGVPAKDGVVVCTSAPACDAGASVLAKGGNAVDAAVATAFALAVTHPSAGNIGGGGFMIVRTPSGETTSFDFREQAPLKATRTMYVGPDGKIVRKLTNAGYLAPGVPGSVRGLAMAHAKFGKLPWKDVVMPGVRLAEDGFAMSAGLARSLNREVAGRMAPFPASVAAYGKPGGGKWAAGDRLILGDLGKTLRAIATDGPDAFYKGWIADAIDADMAANGGLISKADLEKVLGEGAGPAARAIQGVRDRLDAASQLRRDRPDRDAEHRRAVQPEVEGVAHGPGASHPDRSDAPRVPRPRPAPGRSGFRHCSGREVDVQNPREGSRRLDQDPRRPHAAWSSARTS